MKLSHHKQPYNVKIFLLGDIKNVFRDPFMMIVLTSPLYMFFLVHYGIPFIDSQLEKITHFSLTDHLSFIMIMCIAMAPMMVGMLTGFLLLDEKDDGIFQYIEITPLKKIGYIVYRIFFPLFLSSIITVILSFLLVNGLELHVGIYLLALFSFSCYGPLLTMFLATFCQNKVEGIAYAKLINILLGAPVINYMFDGPWTVITYLVPFTWGAELMFASITSSYYGFVSHWFFLFVGGLLSTGVWLLFFFRKIQKNI
ncbi:ABC transporter permease [Alkalihalobacillus sp. LMS39]|uniref:ABC transporter permease n=1 Tax=Alkalihalobacillus sp. LMS39 TaxID=2924032 RepID=UPI001FB39EDD|nr:ABC transporter permease [Alkalihalobacillus sp. LMS39]UOE92135.1 ABC transporter permease [Alkalihalobacillus sp. LMS39]